jgi:hypothetical protein
MALNLFMNRCVNLYCKGFWGLSPPARRRVASADFLRRVDGDAAAG